MYYTRKVWSHIFCMEEYAIWMLWGGSDKADSSEKSNKWLSKAGTCYATQKRQAGCVWRKSEVSVLEAFLQLISSQKGSHRPYLPPPKAERATGSSLCGLPPVLQPVSACLHTADAAQSLEWQHTAMPMPLKRLEPSVGSEKAHCCA